jgi:hypothetical protein
VAIQFHNLAAHGIQNSLALFIMRSHSTAINATWTDGQISTVDAAPIINPIQNDRHRLQSNGLMLAHSSMFSHILMYVWMLITSVVSNAITAADTALKYNSIIVFF